MENLDKYLSYLQEDKLKQRITRGGVSSAGIEKLKKSGVLKPEEEYIKGVEKGTKNIMKKSGSISVPTIFKEPHSRGIPFTNKSIVRVPVTNRYLKAWSKDTGEPISKQAAEKLKPYVKRHEADEASVSKMLKKKYGGRVEKELGKGRAPIAGSGTIDAVGKIKRSPEERKELSKQWRKYRKTRLKHIKGKMGEEQFRNFQMDADVFDKPERYKKYNIARGHASPRVLKKEKKLVDYGSKVYGHAEPLKKVRDITGEYKHLDKLKNKTIRKIEKSGISKKIENIKRLDTAWDELRATKAKGIKAKISKLKGFAKILGRSVSAVKPTVITKIR